MGDLIRELADDYGKEVMIFETGFAWTNGFSDNYNNFLNGNGNVLSYPKTETGQRSFLLDLAQEVESEGGTGVIYWEPGWITSNLCDQWGQGSSYENVAMFDTEDYTPLSSFDFFEYCTTSIGDTGTDRRIEIYPNPVQDSVIRFKNVPLNSSWELMDESGRVVAKGTVNSETIQVNSKLQGVYFITIWLPSEKDKIVEKLLFK